MNSSIIGKALSTLLCLFAALWVSFDVFTAGSNAVGRTYMYILGFSALFGLLWPRKAFYYFLFLTGYLDWFKKFLIFDNAVSYSDLYCVLGIAPATMAGIVAGLLYQTLTGRLRLRPGLLAVIILSLAATALAVTLGLATKSGLTRSLGDVVQGSAYISVLFVTPLLFRTPEELKKLVKVVVLIYVPSCLYMLVHLYRGGRYGGYFSWEIDYMKSGLTMEINQLREGRFRPGGTMNAAAYASMMMSICATLCLTGWWMYHPSDGNKRRGIVLWRFPLAVLFGIAAYSTFSRMGWLTAVIILAASLSVRYKITTVLGYAVGLSFITFVITNADDLLKSNVLGNLTMDLIGGDSSASTAQALNLATFNDRLKGYETLLNSPKAWTPFGLIVTGEDPMKIRNYGAFAHDVLTDALIRVGYIPVTIFIVVGIYLLVKLHRFQLTLPPGFAKMLCSICIAVSLGIGVGAFANGAQFSVFPINFYLYFFLSIVISLMILERERPGTLTAPEPAEEAVPLGVRLRQKRVLNPAGRTA